MWGAVFNTSNVIGWEHSSTLQQETNDQIWESGGCLQPELSNYFPLPLSHASFLSKRYKKGKSKINARKSLPYLRDRISEWTHECNNGQNCGNPKSNSRGNCVFRNPEWQPRKNDDEERWRIDLNERICQSSFENKLCDQMGVSTCKDKKSSDCYIYWRQNKTIKFYTIHISNRGYDSFKMCMRYEMIKWITNIIWNEVFWNYWWWKIKWNHDSWEYFS